MTVGQAAVEADEINKHVIAQLFCEQDNRRLGTAEVIVTVDSNVNLKRL